jgi:DNA-binding transcriptional regulator YiaG
MTDSNPADANSSKPAARAAAGIKLSSQGRASLKAALRDVEPTGPVSLRQLRRIQHLTQAQVATAMGTEQDRVSRLERRADLRLSTLREYVAALGGSLRLVADFPDREPVTVKLPERDATTRPPRTLKPTVD